MEGEYSNCSIIGNKVNAIFVHSFTEESTSVKIRLEAIYFVTGVELRDRTHSCRAGREGL
jgi:hypothetical protein